MEINKIDPVIREMYDDIDAELLPFIKSRAYKFSGLEFDDVVQEARLALLMAMHKYDYNRANGDYVPYLKTVVMNACRGLFSKQKQRSRTPWVARRDGQDWIETPLPPISIDTSEDCCDIVDRTQDCETAFCLRQTAFRVQSFRDELEKERTRLKHYRQKYPPNAVWTVSDKLFETSDWKPIDVTQAPYILGERNSIKVLLLNSMGGSMSRLSRALSLYHKIESDCIISAFHPRRHMVYPHETNVFGIFSHEGQPA